MILSLIEISDAAVYIASLPDGKGKDLLNRMLFDYGRYVRVGSPEECEDMQEWMDMSINDLRKNFNSVCKGLREQVEIEIKSMNAPKRRGRPPKDK